jgi:hypothetical protein
MDFDVGGAAALLGGGDGGNNGGDGGAADGSEALGGGADGGNGGGEGAVIDPDWYGGISGDIGEGETASNRDYIKAKGFKDLDGLVKAYRSAEKGLHDSGRVKVPGEGASAEEVAAFRAGIGVPENAEGYEIKLPETSGGLELDGDMIGKLAAIAHENGLPKAGFEAVANAYVAQQVEDHIAEVKRQDDLTQAQLKAWGADKDAKLADCQAAMRGLGLDRSKVAQLQAAWGSDEALKFLAKIGGGIAEDTLITGGSGRFGVSASEAQAEINRMKADQSIMDKIMTPGTAERQRWDRLNDVIDQEAKKRA